VKKSAEYPGSENLVLAAIALETTEYVRSKYGQNLMYNQQSIIGILMSILGWNGQAEANQMTEIYWRNNRVKTSQFEQRLTNMISAYVFERIIMLDREQKRTALEIAEWLRKIADFTEKQIESAENFGKLTKAF
jgi:hypothetical protein